MNTTMQGNISQANILAALANRGYKVLLPFGEGFKYDLVVEIDGKFYTVQCKTGRCKNGTVIFNTNSAGVSYRGAIDYFAVWCAELGKAYLVDVASVPSTIGTLRFEPAKNNQANLVKWALEYEL
jgi:hypothetical protein